MADERPKLTILPGDDRSGAEISFLLNLPGEFIDELLAALGMPDAVRVAASRRLTDIAFEGAEAISKGATEEAVIERSVSAIAAAVAEIREVAAS